MTKHLRNMQQQEDGFTLIELLVVVLIIGILAAIAIPVYLGIQAGGHKSAVRSDVNIKVKTIQASLTEGAKVADFLGTTNGTETGETIQVKASTTTGAAANDFMVVGSESTTGTPKAAIDYTYTYDSVTGNFTDSDSAAALGASNPNTPLVGGVNGGTYTLTMETTDTTTSMVTPYAGSAFSTTLAHNSTRSLRIANTAYAYLRPSPGLTVGQKYTFTAWVYVDSTDGGVAVVNNTTGTYIDTVTTKNKWVQVTGTFTNTSTSTYFNFGSSGGGSGYVDDVVITPTS